MRVQLKRKMVQAFQVTDEMLQVGSPGVPPWALEKVANHHLGYMKTHLDIDVPRSDPGSTNRWAYPTDWVVLIPLVDPSLDPPYRNQRSAYVFPDRTFRLLFKTW